MTDDPRKSIGVALIGYSFMGAAHSVGWRQAGRVFDDVALEPRMQVLVGRNRDQATIAADRLGWAEVATDYREVLQRDDIGIVDICTPGDSHAEIAIAALNAGKHVLCEKPLANTAAEATAMAQAAGSAAGIAMVGFNYRRVPAVALARKLIESGDLGEIRHVRAVYLQDWIVDPEFPLVWRLQAEHAGSGALGDLGAHIVDLAQYLTGSPIASVTATTETFVKERPLPDSSSGLSGSAAAGTGPVTVDDAALFLARFDNGALGTFEATRFATGRKNGLRIEINGADGSVVFDVESLNELWYYDGREPAAGQGFRRILVTEPEHPYLNAWWPPGHLLGYEHSFVHEIHDLLAAIADGTPASPDFDDGLGVQQVLEAVQASAASGTWQKI